MSHERGGESLMTRVLIFVGVCVFALGAGILFGDRMLTLRYAHPPEVARISPVVRDGFEIQLLINDAMAHGSHVIRIPNGTYVIRHPIPVPNGMTLFGNMSTLIEPDDCTTAMFTIIDKEPRDITFDGFNFPGRDPKLPTEKCR